MQCRDGDKLTIDAALQNSMHDPYIMGIYFWAWSYPVYQPNNLPAAHVLLKWYGKCGVSPVEQAAPAQ